MKNDDIGTIDICSKVVNVTAGKSDNHRTENIVRNIFDHARLFAVTQFHDAVYRIQNHAFKEALHGSYVEFHCHGHNHFHSISLGIGFFIGAFGNQGIIDIRYGQNLGIGADFLRRHTHRVSVSVDLFMVL